MPAGGAPSQVMPPLSARRPSEQPAQPPGPLHATHHHHRSHGGSISSEGGVGWGQQQQPSLSMVPGSVAGPATVSRASHGSRRYGGAGNAVSSSVNPPDTASRMSSQSSFSRLSVSTEPSGGVGGGDALGGGGGESVLPMRLFLAAQPVAGAPTAGAAGSQPTSAGGGGGSVYVAGGASRGAGHDRLRPRRLSAEAVVSGGSGEGEPAP
jgi:hypothetical protein